jgi:hypothetical protein
MGFGFGCTGVGLGRIGDVFYWWPVLWPVASLHSWIDGLLFVTSSWTFMALPT